MANLHQPRFKFIAHALDGDGGFRPVITTDGSGTPLVAGLTYLNRYPRESDLKFCRRNEVAWFDSPLLEACSRFVGYLSKFPPTRTLQNDLYLSMAEDIDGKANSLDVFWSDFMIQAKARGSMCLLVDMPRAMAPSLAAQIDARVAPYWTPIKPEIISDYQIGDDGKFDWAEFPGTYTTDDGEAKDCVWHFSREGWQCYDKEKRLIDGDAHNLGECPLLIFTERGDFPCFGQFSAIADLAKRLFNLNSELDEILRSQTFSLLTMQVPDGTTNEEKVRAAQAVGETIGTNNLMVHTGSTPAFIAPDAGPASTYLERIATLQTRIDRIALSVEGSNQRESGIALEFRFQALNASLSAFASSMEDLERRAWELSRRWLGMTQDPVIEWKRDYSIADVEREVTVLQQMQAAAMPAAVIAEQQRRVVMVQFGGLEQDRKDAIDAAIDESLSEVS
jgi:hypothetical protein